MDQNMNIARKHKVVNFRLTARSLAQLLRLADDRDATMTAVFVQLLERADCELDIKKTR